MKLSEFSRAFGLGLIGRLPLTLQLVGLAEMLFLRILVPSGTIRDTTRQHSAGLMK